jgi:hypothetical protein
MEDSMLVITIDLVPGGYENLPPQDHDSQECCRGGGDDDDSDLAMITSFAPCISPTV